MKSIEHLELRTRIDIESSPFKITYVDPVMFIGSCFATSIGSKMAAGRMPVLINPAGTVYNPVSIISTLKTLIPGREFEKNDLYCHNGTWVSFSHYTGFSSDDPEKVLVKINRESIKARDFISKAHFLFITFGTARVFRLKKTGEIVSNCHKMPAELFESELLTVDEIVNIWRRELTDLRLLYPELKIIFTISPVRHWKDGAHGNQVSKSVLFLAVEELLHNEATQYFPAYELLMDDLRDYRFYNDDLLNPSPLAIDYIWKAFSESYMNNQTINTWKEAARITKAAGHRISTESVSAIGEFAERMLKQISELQSRVPSIDLSGEKKYFMDLLK